MSALRSGPVERVQRSEHLQKRRASWMACLAVLAVVLLGWVLPQAATAHRSFALSRTEKPRFVCPKATPGHVQCMAIRVPTVPASSASAIRPEFEGGGEKGGYDPKDLREAYKLPEAGGSSQTVAITDPYNDPDAESDLQKYREKYKVYFKGTETACTEANGCFKKVNEAGETKNYPENNALTSEEISLDLDMVSAACSECHILLVEATNEELVNLLFAVEEAVTLKATEISNSWDSKEFSTETEVDHYLDHPGIPILFAGGDAEYDSCNGEAGLCWPAASQYVISVGGTKLTKESKSARGWTEEVWLEAKEKRGSGSGCSAYETKPKWQTDKACAKRTDNDVAADASGESPVSVYDSYILSGWENFGGTSAAAPFVAGVEALSSSYARSIGAEAFYLAGKNGLLFGVTKGDNGTCTPPAEDEYLCTAKTGYNGPAGNGTPDGPLMLAEPTVATGSASGETETGATLHGTVNPNGLETKYYFEYGTTTSYGSKTSETSAGDGTSGVEESAGIASLTPGTTYDFRIVATNSAGTTHGSNHTFATTIWSAQEPPLPTGALRGGGYPFGVSCTSSTACIGVSYFVNSVSASVPLAESWNGTAWSDQEPPLPKGADDGYLYGVSCTSSTACTAAGYFISSSTGKDLPLAESWNGTAWSAKEPPLPKGASAGYLYGVSCTSSTACTAAGEFVNETSGKHLPLAESWNGTAWSTQEPPLPTGAKEGVLYGVSCTSATACTAVGNLGVFASSTPFAETWNGTAWSAKELPLPKEATPGYLRGVSCTSSTACTAAGALDNSSGHEVPLAESWNGTAWSAQELPLPKGAEHGVLYGVSCASAMACTAAGYFINSSAKEVPLADSWNGTAWSAQEPPDPTGAKEGHLFGVSCTSLAACTAVGRFENSSEKFLPLAERYH